MVSFVTEFINVIAEVFIIHTYLSRTLPKKDLSTLYKWIAPIIAVVIMTLMATVVKNSNLQLLFSVTLVFMWSLIYYKGSIPRKMFTTLIFTVIMITSDAVFIAILYILNFGEPYDLLTSGIGRLLGMTGSKIVAFWMTVIIGKISSKKYRELPAKYWIIMILMPFFSSIILYGVFSASLNSDRIAVVYLTSVICIMLLNYFIYNFFDTYSAQIRLNLLEQKIKYDDENYKYIKDVYAEIRQLKHDIKNQIKISEELYRQGNPQQALENIKRYSSKINSVGDVCYTGFPSIDALINIKGKAATEKNIKFQIKASLSEQLKVDELELCRIFGNALDNAIEACERIKVKDKFILLSITQNETHILKIRCSNSSGEIRIDKMDTEKTDTKMHGLGLQIIKKSVKKLGGIMSYQINNDVFTLNVLIKC